MFTIINANCSFKSGDLKAPFGFKGKYITFYWHSAVRLEDEKGNVGCAPGMQSVVWSDPAVFEKLGQSGGNAAMYLITAHAVDMVRGKSFENPIDMLHQIFEPLYEQAVALTGIEDLKKTFVLNALVPLDLAAWQLYARSIGAGDFDAALPKQYHAALCERHDKLAFIPLITYNVSAEGITTLADEGAFLFKIKLGCDPDGDGDPEKMLQWDMKRITQIHQILKEKKTPYTTTGKPAYYFDANGRYDSRERLERLVAHLEKEGALEQTVLLEEPFPEGSGIDVHGIPVCIAADESAHGVKETKELIALGYRAVALKPIAKTLSVSLEVVEYAHSQGIACFCADLTVPPLMVDWNKNVAARLQAIPGLKVGVLESNGKQNYTDWELQKSYHSMPNASFLDDEDGLFILNEEFYATSGGILKDSPHYLELTKDCGLQN